MCNMYRVNKSRFMDAFLVKNPCTASVYGCKDACIAMSSLSVKDGRYQIDLNFEMHVYLIEFDTTDCSSQGIRYLIH